MKTFFVLIIGLFFASQIQAQASTAEYQLLPENLAYFTAERVKTNVELEWQTVNEQATRGFAVQRKTDAGWVQVAFVLTNAVGGNSSVKTSYQFVDANLFNGVSQYRVTEMTNNGKQKMSEVRAVKGEKQSNGFIVYPNPSFNGELNMLFENKDARDIMLVDVAGHIAKQFQGVTSVNVFIEDLPAGFYSIRINDKVTAETFATKIVVAKH